MSGIYIHIPFCKQKCTYCDFYTIVAPGMIDSTINSIAKEISIRENYLPDHHISTIYFGGGTPSILQKTHFEEIFKEIYSLYSVDQNAEITFEANPDDLNDSFLKEMKNLSFNRISIGIQSFSDQELKIVNRRHTGQQAIDAVKNAQKAGFNNISVDLIYGLPEQTLETWKQNVQTALDLNIQHISTYGLTFEEGTPLTRQLKKGTITQAADESMNQMYELLLKMTSEAGFEAYEISNLSLPGFRSRHNSAYWKMIPYMGIGPSAHSYNLHSRQWNMSSVKEYNEAISKGEIFWHSEELTTNDNFNDYIMVTLRTAEGYHSNYVEKTFGSEYNAYFLMNAQSFINTGHIISEDNNYRLSTKGIEISDFIISNLMKV